MKIRIIYDISPFWFEVTSSTLALLEQVGITFYDLFEQAIVISCSSFNRLDDDVVINAVQYHRLEQGFNMLVGNNRPLLNSQPVLNYANLVTLFQKCILGLYRCMWRNTATALLQNCKPSDLPITIGGLEVGRLTNNEYVVEVSYESRFSLFS